MTPKHESKANGGTSLRAKRLAQITMVTKNIKKGRLPPIKSPKQLDVFVFGEKQSSSGLSIKQKLDKNRGEITGPSNKKDSLSIPPASSRVKRNMTIVESEYNKGETQIDGPQMLFTED